MTNENELAIVEHVNGTSLENYRDRNEVRELAQRLLSLHPQAKEIGDRGMTAVAQLALLVGASPLPGTNEIHVWKSGDKIQFQLGINFYRRMASDNGGILWAMQPRPMRENEREMYGVPNGMIAAICKGVRSVDMDKYLAMGVPANQIFDMAGRVGIGTCRENEGAVGRTPTWKALKRAEVDLCRALFPTMMTRIYEASHEVIENIDVSKYEDLDDGEFNEMLFGDDGTSPTQEPLFPDEANGAYEDGE